MTTHRNPSQPRRRGIRIGATLIAALALFAGTGAHADGTCDRACMSGTVDQLLASMPAHDPDRLPLANVYAATENSHPGALGMMTAWRTITRAGKPALLAIDTTRGQAYFALPVTEGAGLTALWGRIKVVDRRIAEVEIYLNRSRGDHGFSFSAQQMPANYAHWMKLPASRKKDSRETLDKLARASFDASDPYAPPIAADCQFSEVGSLVIDPGLDDEPPRPSTPLGCIFPPNRPTDKQARVLVVDDETGIVVVAAIVAGTTYPYPFQGHMVSAFIPDDMKEPQVAQQHWIARKLKSGKPVRGGLLAPLPATAEVFQVLQMVDGKLEGLQINIYLSGPHAQSVWVK